MSFLSMRNRLVATDFSRRQVEMISSKLQVVLFRSPIGRRLISVVLRSVLSSV